MLKHFEEPSDREPKGQESSKEGEGLELAKEIKRIKEKISRGEEETEEGYLRIIELAKQIEKLFSPEMQLEAGVVIDVIEKLEKNTGQKIRDAADIHSQPDGTLAGAVQLADGRWVNFFWDKKGRVITR
jgi:flagellar motility protein MotE (MotC chaperone)